ncbi:MAG: HAD family hydrolase [Ginsengibacter sp.]
MQKFKNIIFDLGGVILDVDYNLTRTAFEKLGVTHFDEMYSQANADKLFQKLETGEITDDVFYKEFNRCTGLQLSDEEIRKAWDAMLLYFRGKSLEFLERIRPRYKTYLLSNTNYVHIAAFKQTLHQQIGVRTLEEYFDEAFYSCEIGLRKPDAACYEWVLKNLKIQPDETLFIDDSLHNIQGAKKAGLQTIHLLPGMKIEDLEL